MIFSTIKKQGLKTSLRALFFLCAALLAAGDATVWSAANMKQENRSAQATSYRDRRLVARAESLTGDEFRFAILTPRGVRVFTRTDGERPRAETLRAIDEGLGELFTIARRNGYSARTRYADYTVFIARPDRTRNRDGEYSPDVALPVEGNYAGSIYDQGGFVYAAGLVVAFDPCAFVVAEHEQDFTRVRNVARYEAEHIILYHNDRQRYHATLDHARAGAHPILQ